MRKLRPRPEEASSLRLSISRQGPNLNLGLSSVNTSALYPLVFAENPEVSKAGPAAPSRRPHPDGRPRAKRWLAHGRLSVNIY